MKPLLSKSSLARDFNLISLAIIVLLFLASLWVVYESHNTYLEKLTAQLEAEAVRTDRTLALEIEQASYLIESLGQQVTQAKITEITDISQMIKSFSSVSSFRHELAWINEEQELVANSSRGVLSKPIDVSDRDYVKKTITDPWTAYIGRPIKTRLSDTLALPVALGVDSSSGKYLGTILVHLDINAITLSITESLQHSSTNFAVVSHNLLTIAEDTRTENFINSYFPMEKLAAINFVASPMDVFSSTTLLQSDQQLTFYLYSSQYPYLILLGRSISLIDILLDDAWPKLLQLILVAAFLLSFLWIMRQRIITPATELIEIADDITKGKSFHPLQHEGVVEMSQLAERLHKISDYIAERSLIEEERQNKIITLKQAKEAAELSNHIKMEFLISMSSELRKPLNTISGFSEVMINQLYGPIENERYLQYANDIHYAANNLQTLIADVLALSKVEANMPELQEKTVDVGFIINKCLRLMSDKISESQVNVEIRMADNLPRIRVDELRFKQIIVNLLSNSLDHTPASGEVVIETRIEADNSGEDIFLLVFTDFFPKKKQLSKQELPSSATSEKIEEAHKSSYKRNVGTFTNLTLPLTKALVAMHQGKVEIENPPGRASTVTVIFPKRRIIY